MIREKPVTAAFWRDKYVIAPMVSQIGLVIGAGLFNYWFPETLAVFWPMRMSGQTLVPRAGAILGVSFVIAPWCVVLSFFAMIWLSDDRRMRRYFCSSLAPSAAWYAILILLMVTRWDARLWRGFSNVPGVSAAALIFGVLCVRPQITDGRKWRLVATRMWATSVAVLLVVSSIALFFVAGVS